MKHRHRFHDLTGKKFGRLKVLYSAGLRRQYIAWHCRCRCGGTVVAASIDLVKGDTRSCGCIHAEHMQALAKQHERHNHTKRIGRKVFTTPEYRSWQSMKQRCLNPNAPGYPRYGALGVEIAKRWMVFVNFLHDLGKRPAGTSLSRKLDSGNYVPGNVKWGTRAEQEVERRNRRKHEQH
jgi:hypothetical protein